MSEMKDLLFLLKPDFMSDGRGPCYCPSCATLEGLLGYYPKLRTQLDVRPVDFPRPRPAVIDELGEAHQGLPALVLKSAPDDAILDGLEVRSARGQRFLTSPLDIGRYLARRYGIGEPH